eukprot:m.175387 g.175387  ORF g.175387 m.175387 type:complete len:78 (+) comp17919_c0_seq8:71-304(+)
MTSLEVSFALTRTSFFLMFLSRQPFSAKSAHVSKRQIASVVADGVHPLVHLFDLDMEEEEEDGDESQVGPRVVGGVA